MITEVDCFPALNAKFEFIAMDKNPQFMVVRRHWCKEGFNVSYPYLLPVKSIDVDILKRYDLWKEISPEVQKEIENLTVEQKQAVHSLLEKARAGRKNKYPNVPRELICIKCSAKIAVQPGVLVKRVEKIAASKGSTYTVEDYVKAYECQECHPTIGRKKGSGLPNVPRELVCSCGNKVSVLPSILVKRVEKLGVALEDYVKDFKCQTCKPTKGRKANPEMANIPRELVCACGFRSPCAPSSIVARAKAKGKTVEEFLKGYRCQKCNPTKGRPRKNKVLTSAE